MEDKSRLLILYASQTGNAEDVAERIGREAERRHCNAVVLSTEDFDVRCLPNVELVIFVVSTTGQGDPPDSMKEFWKFLLMRSLGHQWLDRTHYALFGLGDSGYQKFNMVAKKLDKRLSDLGARPIIERGLGDDQHRSGYEAALDPWLSSLWEKVEENFPHIFVKGMIISDIETNALDLPKFYITYHSHVDDELLYKSSSNKEPGTQDKLMECLRARAMIETANNANKSIRKSNSVSPSQCFARMIENKPLTGEDYERDVRHIEFDLGCSDIHYEVGDVLEVMPSQNVAAVDAFFERCGLDADVYITVEQRKSPNSSSGSDTMFVSCQPVKLRTLVESTLDIASASPRRYFFEVAETRFASHRIVLRRLVRVKEALCQMVISNKWGGWKQVDTEKAKIVKDLIFSDDFWNRVEYALELTEPLMSMLRYADTDEPCLGNIYDAMDSMLERMKSVMSHFATAEHEKERLQYFASPEGRDDLYQYNQKERRTVIEILEDFPSVHLPLEWLLQLVPRLRSRMFSISSSLLAHPNQVHITVAVVSWMTPYKRKRYGLCSSWLAGLDPRKEMILIPVWFHRGSLKPPTPSIPLVLIGPGTGCAPFRAFIEQREVLRTVEPVAPILFFFGCRNEAKDFLYKDFWLSNMANYGVLSQERGGGFFVAFSRDQQQKVYVQHKMQEESRLIWNLLKLGASVYVAGSASKMPTDVMSALEEIISREGGFSKESASRWLRQLEKVGRYHVEAWS